MRPCCLCIIALVCFAGCNSSPEVDPDLIEVEPEPFPQDWQDSPPRPFVSLLQVVERGGKMVWRESGEPFSGTLVTYEGLGHHLWAYSEGRVPDGLFPAQPNLERHLSSAEETARDALRYHTDRHGPGHNTYIDLARIGEESDVPMLLASLRSFAKREDGLMVCSQAHCVAALRVITGENPGSHYSDWAAWWKRTYGTEVPDWKPLGE